jgi:integrase
MLDEHLKQANEEAVTIIAVDDSQKQDDVLFCDYIGEWLEIHKTVVALTTYNNDCSKWRKHIYPYFKRLNVKLRNLQAMQIQKYYADKQKEGLNSNTVLKHHIMIRSALQYAKKNHMIAENMADLIDRKYMPKKKKYIGEFLNAGEIQQVLKHIKGEPVETPVMLACYYGLRRSEILGIKWQSVDFYNRTISIKHKVVPVVDENGKYSLLKSNELKTDASYRTLSIDDSLYNYLVSLKAKQESNKQIFGKGYNKEYKDYICVNDTGDILQPNYVSKAFKEILVKNGMKVVRFHDLRHSTASLLLSLGYGHKHIQWLLGHGEIGTTMNIYAHLGTNEKINVIQGISSALN